MAPRDLISGRVLVTGATGGLGQAIARAFAARGATLILTGRRTSVLEPLAEELGARAIVCDLGDRDEVERLIDEMGEIDVLATNAGVPAMGALIDLTRDQIDQLLEVNLRAQMALAQAAAIGMVARRRGHIVLMSSLAAKTTAPATSIYSTTKFALRGFGLGIREDLRPYGVGVSVVMPGFISDAGMLVEAGIELPPGIGTRTAHDVAVAVLRGIERNRAEVEVAPLKMRLGSAFANLAPELASAASRRRGGNKVAAAAVDSDREQR